MSLIEEVWNNKKNYFVYIYELVGEDNNELMKHIYEMELPVRDKINNFILQPEDKGWKGGRDEGKEESFIETKKILIGSGSSDEFIGSVMEVSDDYVNRTRVSMENE